MKEIVQDSQMEWITKVMSFSVINSVAIGGAIFTCSLEEDDNFVIIYILHYFSGLEEVSYSTQRRTLMSCGQSGQSRQWCTWISSSTCMYSYFNVVYFVDIYGCSLASSVVSIIF